MRGGHRATQHGDGWEKRVLIVIVVCALAVAVAVAFREAGNQNCGRWTDVATQRDSSWEHCIWSL